MVLIGFFGNMHINQYDKGLLSKYDEMSGPNFLQIFPMQWFGFHHLPPGVGNQPTLHALL